MRESYSERHVVSIAVLTLEIARSLNVYAFEALEWLALNCDGVRRVVGYSKGRISQDSRPYEISKPEVVAKLRRLAKAARQRDMTDAVPPSANSWGLAAETVLLLAECAGGALGKRLSTMANRTKPRLAEATPAAASNGNPAKSWTGSRIAEARKMREGLKRDGIRDYAAQTAKHFGVSRQRLREVLAEPAEHEIGKRKTNGASNPWPTTLNRVHRAK